MKHVYLSLLFCFVSFIGNSQSYTVTGTVQDSTEMPLIGATVVILSAADSVMAGFAISNGDGQFSIPSVKKGEYDVQVTYIGYGTFQNKVNIDGEEKKIDVGVIRLGSDDNLLDAVEITGKFIPIVIKKDTVEYNADAYRVRPNASVEDLLKKMPGIEVDKDGTITAQGEEVNKVTVDGKSFFGNDPKAATKNLPADAVKKVQVFDEKSRKSQFSGVSDGEEEKTINLELKEDKKKGYFGTAKAGYGTTDRLESKLNINSFNKKLQASAVVGFNNVNDNGFSFSDFQSLQGGGGGFRGGFNSPINLNFGDKGSGDSENLNAGLNLNYDLGKKQNVSLSYYLINTDNNVQNNVYKERTLPSQAFINNDTSRLSSITTQHVINSALELKIDSTQQIDVDLGLTLRDGNNTNDANYLINELNGDLVSNTLNNEISESVSMDIDASMEYNLRLGKKGRIFSFEGQYGRVTSEDSLDIFQEIVDPVDVQAVRLNQFQLDTATNNNIQLELGYKEPLGNDQYIDVEYSRRNYSKYRLRDFINKSSNTRDEDLASATDNSTNYDEYQLRYTYDKTAFQFNAGVKYHIAYLGNEAFRFDQNNALVSDPANTLDDRSFGAILPNISVRTLDRALRINYRTDLNAPSLSDLQTIVDNTDPTNIRLGNANLKPEYEHRFSIRYNKFDRFTFRNIFSSLNYTYTVDNIIDSTAVDALRVITSKPINGSGAHRIRGYISAGSPINPLYVKARLSADGSVAIADNFSDNQLDRVQQWSPSLKLELENLNNDHFTLVGYTRTTWNYNYYDVNSDLNSKFLTQTFGGELIIEFGKGFVLDTEIDYYNYFNDGDKFNDYALWNATISKTFLNDKLTASIKAFDILDQNRGIDVSQTPISVTQSSSNTLQQFFMFSLSYSFSNFGGAAPKNDGIIIMRR